jgi:hypothetical protein
MGKKWKGLFRAGGIGLLVAGVLYIVNVLVLLPLAGGFPNSPEELLRKLASHTSEEVSLC